MSKSINMSENNSLDKIEDEKRLINDKNDLKNNKITNLPTKSSLENKEINNQFLNKKKFFKVIYPKEDEKFINSKKSIFIRKKIKCHNELSTDNITTTIIRHFTNFVFGFINQSIKEGLSQTESEKIEFKNINNEKKLLIKVKDIKNKNIKEFLCLKNENDNIYKKLLKKMDYSFNNLFKINVLKLFCDIYNTNGKEINLEKYDVKGVKIFNLSKQIETIDDLKVKIIKNNGEKKLKILESVINRRFLKIFKVTKK